MPAIFTSNQYYVYVATLDQIPRYVGVGRGLRFEHVNSGTSHNRKLNYAVLALSRSFEIEMFAHGLTKDRAFELESRLIHQYGMDIGGGSLYNETFGGLGYSNGHTIESKKKISETSKRRWAVLRNNPVSYAAHIEKLKQPNSGQFKPGQGPRWLDGSPKTWVLTNQRTNHIIEFTNRQKFGRENPKFSFVKNMRPNKTYKFGRTQDWVLTVKT